MTKQKIKRLMHRIAFEFKVEIERYLESYHLEEREYDVMIMKSEQHIKHMFSAALLRVSNGICLQEISLKGKTKNHKLDFLFNCNSKYIAIELKSAWIGLGSTNSAARRPISELQKAKAQLKDLKIAEINNWGVSNRVAVSIGFPYLKMETRDKKKRSSQKENLKNLRIKLSANKNYEHFEVALRPLLESVGNYIIEYPKNRKNYTEIFPSFFIFWEEVVI